MMIIEHACSMLTALLLVTRLYVPESAAVGEDEESDLGPLDLHVGHHLPQLGGNRHLNTTVQ